MDNNLKVVVYEVGKEPEVKEIPDSLKGMQEVVGGYIETVRLPNGLIIICNEEGLIFDLPYNRGLRGNFFVIADKGEDFRSLTDEEITKAMQIENIKL